MQFSCHPNDISQNRGIRPQSRIPCLSTSRTAPQSFLDFRDLENHRPINLEKSFDRGVSVFSGAATQVGEFDAGAPQKCSCAVPSAQPQRVMCVLLAGLTLVAQLGWTCLGSLLCNHFFPFVINLLWRDTL